MSSAARLRMVAAMSALHDGLLAWPWAAEMVSVDGLLGTPARAVAGRRDRRRAVECGRSPEQAVAAFRGIWYYTVGEILGRTHSARRPAADFIRRGAVSFSGGDRWPAFAARDTYGEDLRALVDRLLPD